MSTDPAASSHAPIVEILTKRFGCGNPGEGLSMSCEEAHFLMDYLHNRSSPPEAAPVPSWQPIETAPRDGRMILVYPSSTWTDDTEGDYEVTYWDEQADYRDGQFIGAWHHFGTPDDYTGPTHWMPLPAPPVWSKGAAEYPNKAGAEAHDSAEPSVLNTPSTNSPPEAAPVSLTALIDSTIQRIAELPDRTSPEDWPEAMLVTADELRTILADQLAAALGRSQETK